MISEVASLAKCLAKVERTGTQGVWERRMPTGIWWENGRSMLTRSSSVDGIAMWRGSTLMVEEPVRSHILSLGSTGRLQMEKKELRKAEEEEKARLATREREKEEAARKKAAEANTEKWEKKVQDLQGKIKAKKAFIEEQNNIQKTAHVKGEKMKSADALRQNLRAAELARMTVERESKDLYDLQEQLARHMGKKPKNS